jgi:biopolymer transport protein ExbD
MAVRFRARRNEEPEINLVPFIDVLLVILIFLMLSTTFTRVAELQIDLPTAGPHIAKQRPKELLVTISADGRYTIGGRAIEGRSVDVLVSELQAASQGDKGVAVVISADAAATHQSVVNVMEASQRTGLGPLLFSIRNTTGSEGGDTAP